MSVLSARSAWVRCACISLLSLFNSFIKNSGAAALYCCLSFLPRQLASALSQRSRIRFVAHRGFAASPTQPPSAAPRATDANVGAPPHQAANAASADGAAPPAAAAAPPSKPASAPVAGPSLLHGIARGIRYVFDAIVGNERRDYQVSRNVALRPLPADTPAAESSALAVFQKPMTPWERQWRDKKERLESSAIYQSLEQGIKSGIRRVAQSENVVVKSAVEANRSLQNKIEDMREDFETSQDPTVYFRPPHSCFRASANAYSRSEICLAFECSWLLLSTHFNTRLDSRLTDCARARNV